MSDYLSQDEIRKRHEEAEAELIQIGKVTTTMGTRMLDNLWFIYEHGTYRSVAEYDTLRDYANSEIAPSFSDNDQYLQDMVHVVERIFAFILEQQNIPDPILDMNGIEITPERLIHTKKLNGKLQKAKQVINTLETDEEKRRLIQDLVDPKKTREDLGSDTEHPMIPCWEETNGDGSATFVMPHLDSHQRQFVIDTLNSALDLKLGRWEDLAGTEN